MHINKSVEAQKAPFSVIVLDMMDRYYYSDVVDQMGFYKKLNDYGKAIALADALFVTKNHGWESLEEMNNADGGYDVRVYNADMGCIYAAHEKYKEKWIGTKDSGLAFTPAIQNAIPPSVEYPTGIVGALEKNARGGFPVVLVSAQGKTKERFLSEVIKKLHAAGILKEARESDKKE